SLSTKSESRSARSGAAAASAARAAATGPGPPAGPSPCVVARSSPSSSQAARPINSKAERADRRVEAGPSARQRNMVKRDMVDLIAELHELALQSLGSRELTVERGLARTGGLDLAGQWAVEEGVVADPQQHQHECQQQHLAGRR